MPKILHFEDDKFLTDMYAVKFLSAGFAYSVYDSPGTDPVGIVVQEKPDVIIMDVVMPDMDGFEATRLIKADLRTLPIPLIFFTSLGQDKDVARGKELGAIEYLVKSNHTPSAIVERVREIAQSCSVKRT